MAGGNTKGLLGEDSMAVLPARRSPMLDDYEARFASRVRGLRASDFAIATMLGRSEDSVRRWREAQEALARSCTAVQREGGR